MFGWEDGRRCVGFWRDVETLIVSFLFIYGRVAGEIVRDVEMC